MKAVAITCVRDEGPWLLDWIAHHRACGFNHFLIASHECTDGTDILLDALAQEGVVTHLPFVPEGEKSVQWQAMTLLSAHHTYASADLALFFDVDEYLVLDETPLEVLTRNADAVPLRWHLFGHNGRGTWTDAPVSERFTRAAPDDIALPLAHFFKTLHRPSAFRGLGVHRPKGKNAAWVAASGSPLPSQFSAQPSRINLFGVPSAGERAWLNHYSTRSIEEFVLKSVRGLPNHMDKPVSVGYWAERNFNTVEDLRIAPMVPAAQTARTDLNAFNALHEASVHAQKARLAHLVTRKEVIELMWQLELLADSTPPKRDQLTAHLARLKNMSAEGSHG